MNIEIYVRGLWKVNMFLSDHIADGGKPGIQLVRNPRLENAVHCNHRNSGRHLDVSVGDPLRVNGYGPSLGLVGFGGPSKDQPRKFGNRNKTYTDIRLVPNLSIFDEPRLLKKEGYEVASSITSSIKKASSLPHSSVALRVSDGRGENRKQVGFFGVEILQDTMSRNVFQGRLNARDGVQV